MTVIVRHLTYVLLDDGTQSSLLLQYDTAQPLEVVLNFGVSPTDGKPVKWHVARDVLADGLTQRSGIGDVRCSTCDHGFHLALYSPDGGVNLQLETDQVRAFLVDTEDLVPYGTGIADFDVELSKLLIGGW